MGVRGPDPSKHLPQTKFCGVVSKCKMQNAIIQLLEFLHYFLHSQMFTIPLAVVDPPPLDNLVESLSRIQQEGL